MARYLIWSFEHQAWWRPNSNGYTTDLAQAGRYSQEEAGRIVTQSIFLEEIAILESVVERHGGKPPRFHPYDGDLARSTKDDNGPTDAQLDATAGGAGYHRDVERIHSTQDERNPE